MKNPNKMRNSGRSSHNKSNKGNYRGRGKELELNVSDADINTADIKTLAKHHSNDESWYTRLGQLAIDAANLSYSHILGTKFTPNSRDINAQWLQQTIPGICVLSYLPTIGYADSADAPINVISKALYAYIRSNISGSRPYDPTDVMIYIVAMDTAFYWWTHLCRAYGTVTEISAFNRYKSQTLIEAMGFDFEDLLYNLSDFRAQINYYAKQLGAMCVPSEMTFTSRHLWMNANILQDSASAKAQLFLFKPSGYYVFNEATLHGGELTYYPLPANNLKVRDVISICNQIIQPLLGSSSQGTISGDILRAFGEDKVMKMSQITEDFHVEPAYVPEVLMQFENASIVPGCVPSKIIQHNGINEGYLTQSITAPIQSAIVGPTELGGLSDIRYTKADQIINSHTMEMTPGLNYVATRLMVSSTAAVTQQMHATDQYVLDGVGSEIIQGAAIYYMPVQGTTVFSEHFATTMVVPEMNAQALQIFLSRWTAFDWAPRVYPTPTGQADESTGLLDKIDLDAPYCDYDNYTTITPDELKRIHDVALLNLFFIPSLNLID